MDHAALAGQIMANSTPVPFTGCWLWTASLDGRGYGQMVHRGQHMRAHRASFLAHNPGIEPPRMVCHHCDVRSCVNPAHLYAGDVFTNRADMLNRARWAHPFAARTACSKGHDYTTGGYSIAADGSRVCKTCDRLRKQAERATLKGTPR